MPKCDICQKYFTTKAQMKQHRKKEHTKKIPGTKFRIPKQNFDLCNDVNRNSIIKDMFIRATP